MFNELTLMHALQALLLDTAWAKMATIVAARWLIYVLPIGVLAAWYLKRVPLRALEEMFWSVLLAAVITFSAELVLGRGRPFVTDPTLVTLVPRPHTMSFPSAHASIVYALALTLFAWNRTWGIVALIMADMIVVGRVVVGVHYPTDVLAGLAVGVFSFTLVRWVKGEKMLRVS